MNWSPPALSPADPPAAAARRTLRRRHRGRTLEAAAWVLLARLLIALAPFSRWERRLGRRVVPTDPPPLPVSEAQALRSRRAARAVNRAADLLPGSFKCLPRAMAAQWMLQRRRIPARLLIGILPHGRRGSGDDLHAWVVVGTETVIGELGKPHQPILTLQSG